MFLRDEELTKPFPNLHSQQPTPIHRSRSKISNSTIVYRLNLFKVVPPVRSQRLLPTNIPEIEGEAEEMLRSVRV